MNRTMKKLLSHITIMMLAAMALTSCGQKQAEEEIPFKVTYSIDCSRDLLSLCDLVVTYKDENGTNVIDTLSASPDDTTDVKTWTREIGVNIIPAKIGVDYNLVPRADTLAIDRPKALLNARCSIIAEKMGTRDRVPHLSEKVINSKNTFFIENCIIDQEVANTRRDLAAAIDSCNKVQADGRPTGDNNTCFMVTRNPYGSGLMVKKAGWNDDAAAR